MLNLFGEAIGRALDFSSLREDYSFIGLDVSCFAQYFIVRHMPALLNDGRLIGLLEYGLVAVLARHLQQKIIGIADDVKGSPSLSSLSCQAARTWILDFGQLLTSI